MFSPKKFNFLFSQTPSYLVYHVTNRCNLRCRHCFNYKEQQKGTDELSLAEVAQITSSLGPVKYLTLAGGEPLLREDLAEIVRLFYQNNQLHIANIVTNGWFTDRIADTAESLLTACPGLIVSIGVSVDGPETIHDGLRQTAGSYRRAMKTVTVLADLSTRPLGQRLLVLGCGTYHKENAEHILPTAQFFARDIGVPYYVGLIRGDVRDKKLKEVDIDHFKGVCSAANRLNKKHFSRAYPLRRLRLALDDVVTDVICESVKHGKRTVRCMAGRKGIVLKADGHIDLCELLDIRLGNVRDFSYDPAAVLRSDQTRRAIRKIDRERCHCSWECFQRMNVIFSPRMYPRLAVNALNIR